VNRKAAMSNAPFARNVAAIATPFQPDLTIDLGLLIAHARWLFDHGCDGLVLFGTTGEAVSLTAAERKRSLEALIAADIPAEKIVVGTGCCAVADAVDLSRHAADVGAAGVLVLPPYFYKGVGDDGVARYYEGLIGGCGASLPPLYLYHIPQLSGVSVSPDLLGRLIDRHGDKIRGYKDSSGNWSNTESILSRFPELDVYVGSETLLLEAMRAGGAGCISASVNVQPNVVRAAIDAWRSSDAERLSSRANAVRRALEKSGLLIPAVKAVLARIHGNYSWAITRPPLEPLPGLGAEMLIADLQACGLGKL
jgi:4-hydroxy-tetrahydrodipicolinate synthase